MRHWRLVQVTVTGRVARESCTTARESFRPARKAILNAVNLDPSRKRARRNSAVPATIPWKVP